MVITFWNLVSCAALVSILQPIYWTALLATGIQFCADIHFNVLTEFL